MSVSVSDSLAHTKQTRTHAGALCAVVLDACRDAGRAGGDGRLALAVVVLVVMCASVTGVILAPKSRPSTRRTAFVLVQVAALSAICGLVSGIWVRKDDSIQAKAFGYHSLPEEVVKVGVGGRIRYCPSVV